MDKIFLNVYKGKNVLVTGHTGFVGAWLCIWLKELGAKVIGYSLQPSTKPSLFEIVNLAGKIESHNIGDVTDIARLKAIFDEYQPEVVFHLAAQALVRLSYQQPVQTYQTNIIGTANVLEVVRQAKSVKSCIIVTSDKCYENKEWPYGYRETDPMGGYDPYSSSKGCTELVTAAYRKSFFNPQEYGKSHKVAVSSVRAGNIIGGGDWGQDRLIPDIVKALAKNEKVYIRNPDATRPWQFILEPLSGYMWLGALMYQHGSMYSEAWNFGPESSDILTVEHLVRLFLNEWGSGEHKICKTDQFHEATFLRLDTGKANFLLKWQPVYNVFEAARETAVWYKKFYSTTTENICDFTVSQIDKYIEQAGKKNILWAKIA